MKPTNAALAGIYRTSERQLARWKVAKAPLLDVADMMMWFSTRQDAPDHLKQLGADDQAAMQARIDVLTGSETPRHISAKPTKKASLEGLKGAQYALRRLEEEEERLHRAMVDEPDILKQAVYRKQWLETSRSLKQFDMLVEAGRRDTGETITRAQMQPVLTTLAVWVRRGLEDAINGASLLLAEAESPQRVYATVADPCRKSLGNAVDAATGDGKLPGWVQDALVAGL